MSDEKETVADEQSVAELEALRKKNAELLSEAKSAKAALKKYQDIDPDEYAELKAAHEQAEADKAKAAGDIEAVQRRADKDREKLQAIITDLEKRNENTWREREALAAIAKHGGSVPLLRKIVSDALQVEPAGDGYDVHAVVDGEKLDPSAYVAKLSADPDYAGAFSGVGTGGGGSKPATSTSGGNPLEALLKSVEIL